MAETYPIYSRIVGRDYAREPTIVSESLTDWFGVWLSQHPPTTRPATLRQLLTQVLPKNTWVPFLVGDGSYLQYSAENSHINRQLRFTIIAVPESPVPGPTFPADALVGSVENIVSRAFRQPNQTLCIVASRHFDNDQAFLQVASWDVEKRRLNFYQRGGKTTYTNPNDGYHEVIDEPERNQAHWFYLGSSFDAFAPETEGKGPFCGHVNGTLVMKELSTPWVNWHSTRYSVNRSLSRNDSLFQESLLQPPGPGGNLEYVAVADRLERIVRNATQLWYNSRHDNDFGPQDNPREHPVNVVSWMRHVLTTTTINIAGSPHNSEVVINETQNTRIPAGFFLNENIRDLLPSGTPIPTAPAIPSRWYNSTIAKVGTKTIYDWKNMGIAFQHEGQTPWRVIVPSLEDLQGITTLRVRRNITIEELLALLMIDFPNPVYSRRREALLQYVPATNTSPAFMASFRAAVSASAAAQNPSTPEYEFLKNLGTPTNEFRNRVAAYMTKVSDRVLLQGGVEDYMLLAESRRRIFRPYPSSRPEDSHTNPLSEFQKTLPFCTEIPLDWKHVEMTENAEVVVMDAAGQQYIDKKISERVKLDTPRQCHSVEGEVLAAGCPL